MSIASCRLHHTAPAQKWAGPVHGRSRAAFALRAGALKGAAVTLRGAPRIPICGLIGLTRAHESSLGVARVRDNRRPEWLPPRQRASE
jgi:hypothetical protein